MFDKALFQVSRAVRSPFGVGHAVVEGVESYATGRILGEIQGRYREKAHLPYTELTPAEYVGIGGKVAALGLLMFTRSDVAAMHVNTVADAALACAGFSHGIGNGTKASGRKVYILEGAAPATLPAGMKQTDVVGAIPQAVGGAFMDANALSNLARRAK